MTEPSIARRVAWWSVLALAFLVPVVMSDYALPGIQGRLSFSSVEIVKLSVMTMLTLVALAAWAIDLLRNGGEIRHSPVSWLVLAWLVWVGITTLTSVHWPTALLGAQGRYEGFLTFFTYALIYFLTLQFVGEDRRILQLAKALFFSSVIVSLYGLLIYAGADSALGSVTERPFSTLGHPNVLAGFLIFALLVSLGLALSVETVRMRLLYWGGAALNGLMLLVTFSRGGWIGGTVAVVLMGVIAWRQGVRLRRADFITLGTGGAALMVVAAVSLYSSSGLTNAGARLASIFNPSGDVSASTRLEIWRAALRGIKEHPILGWGPDTFGLVSPRLQSAEFVRMAGRNAVENNAHNYPLHLAVGIGLPGAVLFLAMWGWAFVKSGKTVFSRQNGHTALITGAFWAASLGYLSHLLFNISVPGTTFLLWIALAVILAPTSRTREVSPRQRSIVPTVLVGLVAAACVAGQSVVLAADREWTVANEELSTRPVMESHAAAERAVNLNPLVSEYRSTLATLQIRRVLAGVHELTEVQNDGRDVAETTVKLAQVFAEAESAFLQAIEFSPEDATNYVNLAALYILAGDNLDTKYYLSAIEAAERGLELVPHGIDVRENLAEALIAVGRESEATRVLVECAQLAPLDEKVISELVELYRQRQMNDEALLLLTSTRDRLRERYPTREYPWIDQTIEELKQGIPLE